MPKRKRILIADDHELILNGVAKLLASEFEIVGEVRDGRTLVAETKRLLPDVVILDIGMPELNGIEAARQIAGEVPSARLIFLTQQLDSNYLQWAFHVGARGYVAKQSASTELLEAVRTVLLNRFYVTPLAMEKNPDLLRKFDPQQNPAPLLGNRLTPRQREVLQLVAEGKSAKEVAAALNISAKTAEFHKGCIMDELGLRTTAELTRYAIANGIISS